MRHVLYCREAAPAGAERPERCPASDVAERTCPRTIRNFGYGGAAPAARNSMLEVVEHVEALTLEGAT